MVHVMTFCDMEGVCRLGAIPVADLRSSKRFQDGWAWEIFETMPTFDVSTVYLRGVVHAHILIINHTKYLAIAYALGAFDEKIRLVFRFRKVLVVCCTLLCLFSSMLVSQDEQQKL